MKTKTKKMPLVSTLWTPGELEKHPGQNTQLNNFTALAPKGQAPTAYVVCAYDAALYSQAGNMFQLLLTAIRRIEIENESGNPILSAWLPDAVECLKRANGGTF